MKRDYAIWDPGWYELDQPLTVGDKCEFIFFRSAPDHLAAKAIGRLVFYNTLLPDVSQAVRAEGIIASIENKELGSVSEINTDGLDYSFHLTNGESLVVNAEEEPGVIYEKVGDRWEKSPRRVEDWAMVVSFDELETPTILTKDWKPQSHKKKSSSHEA